MQVDTDLNHPRHLTTEACAELKLVEQKIKEKFLSRYLPDVSIALILLNTLFYLTGILAQGNQLLEWIYTRHTFTKTLTTYDEMVALLIQSARQKCLQISGYDCASLIFPLPKGK